MTVIAYLYLSKTKNGIFNVLKNFKEIFGTRKNQRFFVHKKSEAFLSALKIKGIFNGSTRPDSKI